MDGGQDERPVSARTEHLPGASKNPFAPTAALCFVVCVEKNRPTDNRTRSFLYSRFNIQLVGSNLSFVLQMAAKTSFHPVTHVIFDCDGLLVNSEKYYSLALSEVASKYGKKFEYKTKLDMMGEFQ